MLNTVVWRGVAQRPPSNRFVPAKAVEPLGIESPETGSAPSRPISIDPIREWSVAPRRVSTGKARWRLKAIMPPLIGRWSGGSDGKTPACHSPPPRVPRLTVFGDMERDARFPGQPVACEVVAKDAEHVTAVPAAVSVPSHLTGRQPN